MTTRSEERAEFLWDVATAALEGGIGYWSMVHAYKWVDLPASERYAVIEEIFGDDNEAPGHHRIDIEVVAVGIKRIVTGVVGVRSDLKALITEGDGENEAGMLDSDAGDVILQAAIFNEVVYG